MKFSNIMENHDLATATSLVDHRLFNRIWTCFDRSSDYATTSGQMLQRLRQIDGQQPGDPKKAAGAMIQVVNHPNPLLRLVLGADTVAAIHTKLETVAADLADWKDVSIHTAFEGATVLTKLHNSVAIIRS